VAEVVCLIPPTPSPSDTTSSICLRGAHETKARGREGGGRLALRALRQDKDAGHMGGGGPAGCRGGQEHATSTLVYFKRSHFFIYYMRVDLFIVFMKTRRPTFRPIGNM